MARLQRGSLLRRIYVPRTESHLYDIVNINAQQGILLADPSEYLLNASSAEIGTISSTSPSHPAMFDIEMSWIQGFLDFSNSFRDASARSALKY